MMPRHMFPHDQSVADDIMSWGDPAPDTQGLFGGATFEDGYPLQMMPLPTKRRVEKCELCSRTDQSSWCCIPTPNAR